MATAPTPGTTVAPEPQPKLQLTMHGRTLVLDFAQLGPGDDLLARQETGFPVSSFIDERAFASDSLLILWWMARRKNGEPKLRFAKVIAEFPTNEAIIAADPDGEWLAADVEDEAPEA